MTVAALALGHDLTAGHIECGEQGRGAMTDVIVGHAFDIAQAHRQQRLGTLQCLHLGFLIDAQLCLLKKHPRTFRQSFVHTDDGGRRCGVGRRPSRWPLSANEGETVRG